MHCAVARPSCTTISRQVRMLYKLFSGSLNHGSSSRNIEFVAEQMVWPRVAPALEYRCLSPPRGPTQRRGARPPRRVWKRRLRATAQPFVFEGRRAEPAERALASELPIETFRRTSSRASPVLPELQPRGWSHLCRIPNINNANQKESAPSFHLVLRLRGVRGRSLSSRGRARKPLTPRRRA